MPEDNIAEVVTWEKAKKDTYDKSLQTRPSWISEAETAFLTCIPGYVEKTVDKVKTCIIASGICPVNDIVEKSGTTYKNPDTQDVCLAPEKAVVRNVKGDENLLSYTLADEKAYKFECPANYYPVEDVATSLKVKCDACPTGTSSTKGASSVADCVGKNDVVEPEPVVEEVKEEVVAPAPVVSAPQVNEDEAQRLAKLRIKKVEGTADDYTCIDGWTNNWGTVSITTSFKDNDKTCFVNSMHGKPNFLRKPYIMDKDGKIKNIVDRNNYGKNKMGCPIKTDKFYSYDNSHVDDNNNGWTGGYEFGYKNFKKHVSLKDASGGEICRFDLNPTAKDAFNLNIYQPDYNKVHILGCDSSSSIALEPRLGIVKLEMTSSDIDNTGVKGWTEEEYEAWDGYRPIIAYYYNIPSEFDGKTFVKNCSSIGAKSSSYKLSIYSSSYEEKIQKYLTSNNLFKYWD